MLGKRAIRKLNKEGESRSLHEKVNPQRRTRFHHTTKERRLRQRIECRFVSVPSTGVSQVAACDGIKATTSAIGREVALGTLPIC